MKRVSVAQAKAHLSGLMGEVAHGGEYIVIERRGKPLAALVGIADLERLAQGGTSPAQCRGALALAGAWWEVEEEQMDAIMASIYARRLHDTGRLMETEF